MLRILARHLGAPTCDSTAACEGSASKDRTRCHDLYGNDWAIDCDSGHLTVTSPVATDPEQTLPLPGGELASSVAADASGFIWASTDRALFRLNPRALGTNGAEAQGPTAWLEVGSMDTAPLPTGSIAFISAGSRDEARIVLVTTDGRCFQIDFVCGGDLLIEEGEEEDLPWEVLPGRLPVGNHDHFVCEQGGRLWVAGGLTHYRGFPARLHVFDELFHFDPSTESWGSVPMPNQRCYNGLAAMDGKVFVLGGAEPQDQAQSVRLPQAGVLVYDTMADEWLRDFCPVLPQTRMECTAAAVGGRLYLICGVTEENAGPILDSVLSWSPGEPRWREEPPCPAALRQFCSAVIGTTIYCVGGTQQSHFVAFDTTSGVWVEGLAPHPTGPQAPLVGAHNDELWVCGGSRKKDVHVFTPQTNTWRREPDLPCEQSWGAAYSFEGRLLVVGGAHMDPRADDTPVFDDRVFALRSESFA